MKKIISLIAFSVLLATNIVKAQVNPDTENDWGYLSRYAKANKELKAKNIKPDVVFIGNSITENWAKMDSVFFQSNNFVGRGISGQTTGQFLVRFREDAVYLKPEVVLINGGTNDIAENSGPYNEDYTFNNIITMADIAKQNGIKVVLSSVIPAAGFNWNLQVTDVPEKIKSLNIRIKDYANKNNIPYVDYYSKLIDANGRDIISSYASDGVHPVVDGYKIMESIVLPVLKEQLK